VSLVPNRAPHRHSPSLACQVSSRRHCKHIIYPNEFKLLDNNHVNMMPRPARNERAAAAGGV
jgi:hypothetical protein